ncbi:MAG: general secretion pathway protein A [Halioglobus sp.]|jgi:putative secretion ATPase (PEP-CTERM system associated)
MYEVFYNLKAEPFRLSPDHKFCFDHKGYAKARAYMAYAFVRAEGFVMITGRPGTGKTTLIGEMVESLADENVMTANLVCTQLQADDLLKMVAYSFGISSTLTEKASLLQGLNDLLLKWNREGRRALLIVDEAQDLSPSALEELRLLTNIQKDGCPLLQIFLLGQSELREMILQPSMEQVHQRIVAASHLESLEEEETEAYILHRLEKVGWKGDPALSKAVFPLIYKFSEGVPRRINMICSRLFLHGCVEQRHRIGVADVRKVISELQSENLAAGTSLSEYDFTAEDVFEDAISAAPAPLASVADQLRSAGGTEPTVRIVADANAPPAIQDATTSANPEPIVTPVSDASEVSSEQAVTPLPNNGSGQKKKPL